LKKRTLALERGLFVSEEGFDSMELVGQIKKLYYTYVIKDGHLE
jgi:hypothetical protein